MSKTYFDYAAATPMSDRVKAAMEPYFTEQFYNPSALYQPARAVRQRIEQARETVAKQFGVKAPGVTFTAGITEANNLILQGLARQFDRPKFIISSIEHESISRPAELLAEQGLIDLAIVPVDDQGRVKLAELEKLIDDKTVLISIIIINNETGVIQDFTAIKQRCEQVELDRKQRGNQLPLITHSDAAQAPGVMSLKLNRVGLDVVSVSAAKIYGPKQSAALISSRPLELTPLISGGTQERGVRAGTENVANIVGLETALVETASLRDEHNQQLSNLQQQFETALAGQFEKLTVHSDGTKRAPHISNVVIPGVSDGERLVMELDQRGFLAATGSACTAGDGQPSSIITAISGNEAEAAASLRASFGRHINKTDVDEMVAAISEIVSEGLV